MQIAEHALPLWLSVSAMALNGAFGAAVARTRLTPVFGVILAGILVGLGGGFVRDVLLGSEPVAIAQAIYLPSVMLAAVVGGLLFYKHVGNQRIYLIAQGATLGLLVTIGAQRALDFRVPVLSVLLLGVITASAGGAITDALTQHRAAVVSQAHWLGMALVVGTALFIPLSIYVNFYVGVVASVSAVTCLRFFSVTRNWPSVAFPGEISETLRLSLSPSVSVQPGSTKPKQDDHPNSKQDDQQ